MSIIEALVLGAIQGLTEFIPVSSSGHLVLAEHFMGLEPSLAFDGLVNLGTFLALLIYFRKRLWSIAVRIVKDHDSRLARNILISAVPIGLVGFLCGDLFAQAFIQNAVVVTIMLAAFGIIMILLEYLPKLSPVKTLDQLHPKRALVIGVAQILSLVPGTSRSASTMIAGRLVGLSLSQAAEYSFLLSIPVLAGVIAKVTFSHEGREFITQHFDAWIASNIAAFIFGLIAVRFMLKYLAHGNFKVFGYYRVGLAVILAAVLVLGL